MAIRIVCLTSKEEEKKIREAVNEVANKKGFSVIEEQFTAEDYLTMLGFIGLMAKSYEDEDEDELD